VINMATISRQHLTMSSRLAFISLLLFLQTHAIADALSARQAMENPDNPLLQIATSSGDIFLEMFPREAPNNVDNIIALAEGEQTLQQADTGDTVSPNYYDGLRFTRVIPGLSIQAGDPLSHPLGLTTSLLNDEINAEALGLDLMQVMDSTMQFNPILNLSDRKALENDILIPLYKTMNLTNPEQLKQRETDIIDRLQSLTIKQAYEHQGYRYQTRYLTRPISRGTVALTNTGPDSNGPEFFISVTDANWLSGKYTVIGRIVEGMNVVDAINSVAIDSSTSFTAVTVIQTIRQLE